jgi:hypothetical protein
LYLKQDFARKFHPAAQQGRGSFDVKGAPPTKPSLSLLRLFTTLETAATAS